MRITTPMIPRKVPYSPMSPISPVPFPYPPPRIPFIAGPVPTMTFVADVGSANFINNVLKLSGGTGINTSATGNTVTFNLNVPVAVAYGGTGITTNPTNGQLLIGNGFGYTLSTLTAGSGVTITNGAGSIQISLAGGGSAINSIGTQTGTNPITPTGGGLVTINGAVVAAGTNPVRSDGTGANTMAIEVQTSQAIAAADATKIGLSNFDSASFGVTATGFVTLSGTGVLKTLTGNSGGIIAPTAGNINTLGTGSITIIGSGSTLTTQLTGLTNHSVLVGAGTATITNLAVGTNGQVLIGATTADPAFATLTSSDSSISFTTGANTLSLQVASGTGVVKTLTGNSGGALSPTAGNINTLGTGSITIAGSGSTLTTQLTGLTNHNVLIGAGTSTITNVAPSATSGIPFISQGAAADPTFGTAVVAGGGTGNTTFTAYSVITAGTTATGPFQNVSGLGTSGQLLTSNGAGTLPSWQTAASSGIQTITGNSGGAESPSAGNFNILGTGSITVAGTANTETVQLTGLTNHNVLIGAGTATITKVAPSATSGIPLISQGASADPVFGTAVVAGGGTGLTTTTAYGVITGGTTATGNFQNTGAGTAGQILKSGGAAALPTWVAPSSVGSSLVLISSQTASSSASIIFTSLTTYSILFCTISQAQPVTNTQQLELLISQDNGATYLTTGYTSGINYHAYNSTTYTNFSATAYAPISNTMPNTGILSAQFYMFNLNTGANWKILGQSTWNDSGAATTVFGDIGGQGNTGITAIKFMYASGNIFTGTFTLYGLATS